MQKWTLVFLLSLSVWAEISATEWKALCRESYLVGRNNSSNSKRPTTAHSGEDGPHHVGWNIGMALASFHGSCCHTGSGWDRCSPGKCPGAVAGTGCNSTVLYSRGVAKKLDEKRGYLTETQKSWVCGVFDLISLNVCFSAAKGTEPHLQSGRLFQSAHLYC